MKQFAILLVLDESVDKERAEEILSLTNTKFGNEIIGNQLKEFDPDIGGVVIYQP